jgi:hypothetical protein
MAKQITNRYRDFERPVPDEETKMSTWNVYSPDQWQGLSPEPAPSTYRFLAQGDSWFSIGSLPPNLTTNLLDRMTFKFDACAVNFAQPGAQVDQMVRVEPSGKRVYNPRFAGMLNGQIASRWDAILMSAGGNDLICAVMTPPVDEHGIAVAKDKRLLLLPSEWGPQKDVSRYVSETGWITFEKYLTAVFADLIAMRDHPKSKSQGRPLFVHSYCYIQPRDAGVRLLPVGPWIGGPWLYKAINLYKIPNDEAQWLALTEHLMNRLLDLFRKIAGAHKNVHVVNFIDTLKPADVDAKGKSGDWINEIHPTKSSYRKLSPIYSAAVQKEVLNGMVIVASALLSGEATTANQPPAPPPIKLRRPRSSMAGAGVGR